MYLNLQNSSERRRCKSRAVFEDLQHSLSRRLHLDICCARKTSLCCKQVWHISDLETYAETTLETTLATIPSQSIVLAESSPPQPSREA